MTESLSARIVVDRYRRTSLDRCACLKVRVTSQNGPQCLVSNKLDLANSMGPDLPFIEEPFAPHWRRPVLRDV